MTAPVHRFEDQHLVDTAASLGCLRPSYSSVIWPGMFAAWAECAHALILAHANGETSKVPDLIAACNRWCGQPLDAKPSPLRVRTYDGGMAALGKLLAEGV